MAHKGHGHKYMREIIDGDHPNSVKHHEGGAKSGVGGLLSDESKGYEEAGRHEAFKGGGKFSGKKHHE